MKLPEDVAGARRLAVITGARGGVGEELARDLDRRGWATLRIDIAAEDLERAPYSCPSAYVAADVSDEETMLAVGAALDRERDALLVVAAAGVISVGTAETLPRAEWDRIIRVNLTGVFVTLRSLVAAARAAEVGRLIAVASDAGKTGEAWLPHYSASKFGVVGLVQAMALELVEEGITVNAVCPSIVETPMMQQLAENMSATVGGGTAQEWRQRFVDEVPAGRACLPSDIAYAVSMLAAPEAMFITGQSINIAGGKETH